ncbi:MAG: chemotaxis protein CheX [Mariprofundus sp.]
MIVSDQQRDALTELVNIGVGHAASTLNALINHKIRLTVPEIEVIAVGDLHNRSTQQQDDHVSSVSMGFHGDLDGNASLIFPMDSASNLVAALTGEAPDSEALDELRSGTLAEVGNILLNGVMGSVSNMLSTNLNYTVPAYHEACIDQVVKYQKAEAVLIARAHFYIDELRIEGNVLLFFELESFNKLIDAVNQELAA